MVPTTTTYSRSPWGHCLYLITMRTPVKGNEKNVEEVNENFTSMNDNSDILKNNFKWISVVN